MHLVITDSGLGGLSICAAIERALRGSGEARDARLTYVNVWPEQGHGYNDLPDMQARARVFDRALRRMAGLDPDLVLIACNTLSIVYEHTAFRRDAPVPVQGIVAAGVDLFAEALAGAPDSAIVLLGTRTTIESGVHRELLLQRGVAPHRISAVSCHGLATAIEQGPDSRETASLIEDCAARAAQSQPQGVPVFAGLCCTHYAFDADRIGAALERHIGRAVTPLDPNGRLARDVSARFGGARSVAVEVISKVGLDDRQRFGIANLVEQVSPATAAALRSYRQVPDLFQERA